MILFAWLAVGAIVTATFLWIYRGPLFELDPDEQFGPRPGLPMRLWLWTQVVALFAAAALCWPCQAFELYRDWRSRR